MYCDNCGNKLPDGAEFCTNCGAKQENKADVIQNTPRQATSPRPQQTNRPPAERAYSGQTGELITTKDYVLMMILFAIPIVGIVFMFIWGFGSDTGVNKKNFARAFLILMAISIGISILVSIFMGILTASLMSSMY